MVLRFLVFMSSGFFWLLGMAQINDYWVKVGLFIVLFLACSDLDENLHKGFNKYLEVRGITPSLSYYLCEYMINKESKEYTNWLKNVKEIVEK